MLRALFTAFVLMWPLVSSANDGTYKYQCELAGEKSDVGTIVTVFTEDEVSVVVRCEVPLTLDFKGEAKYKIEASKAQWILFNPKLPIGDISGPHQK